MLSRAQNTFLHNPRLRGPVSSYTLSSVKVAGGHLLVNSCPLGWSFVLIVF